MRVCAGSVAPTLYAIGLLNVGSTLNGLLVAVVPDGNVGTGLGEALGNGKTNTSASAGDNGGLALEGEEGKDAVVLGSNGVVLKWMN